MMLATASSRPSALRIPNSHFSRVVVVSLTTLTAAAAATYFYRQQRTLTPLESLKARVENLLRLVQRDDVSGADVQQVRDFVEANTAATTLRALTDSGVVERVINIALNPDYSISVRHPAGRLVSHVAHLSRECADDVVRIGGGRLLTFAAQFDDVTPAMYTAWIDRKED